MPRIEINDLQGYEINCGFIKSENFNQCHKFLKISVKPKYVEKIDIILNFKL